MEEQVRTFHLKDGGWIKLMEFQDNIHVLISVPNSSGGYDNPYVGLIWPSQGKRKIEDIKNGPS